FNDLRFDVMSYIDKFHPQLINEKFQKLVYEKEKLIRELKDNLKINDIIVEPSEIVPYFNVNVNYYSHNKVGDDYTAKMQFFLSHPDFTSTDLTWLKIQSYNNWTILDYRACSGIDLDYINKIKEKDYSKEIDNILEKVKATFLKKFSVVDKWIFSEKSKTVDSFIQNIFNEKGFEYTLNNLYSILNSYVSDLREYFKYDRKLIENNYINNVFLGR